MAFLRNGKPVAILLLAVLPLGFVFWTQLWAGEQVPAMAQSGPILIIDAGHGGADGGASTAGGILEADINLEIARKTNDLAHLFGKDTVMTRSTPDIVYPAEANTIAKQKVYDQKSRAVCINQYPNGVLLSIHQNFYPDARPSGAQVLYGRSPESEVFGKLLHVNLVAALDPSNRRVAAPIDENIYLMRKAQCTAALVECGFLSNPTEAALLTDDAYQNKISVVLIASYLEYLRNTAL